VRPFEFTPSKHANEHIAWACRISCKRLLYNYSKRYFVPGFFRQYDYGFLKNLLKYGNTTPPEYNLAAITSPVSLIVGPNDWLATPEVSESSNASLLVLVFVMKAVKFWDDRPF
jgi:hypothetical protein